MKTFKITRPTRAEAEKDIVTVIEAYAKHEGVTDWKKVSFFSVPVPCGYELTARVYARKEGWDNDE